MSPTMAPQSTVYSTLLTLSIYGTQSSSYYAISNSSGLSWYEANLQCNNSSPRGQLTSFHNTSIDTTIGALCSSSSNSSSESCWIGLHRNAGSYEWRWVDGSDVTFGFEDNDPSNPLFSTNTSIALQSCIAMTDINNISTWKDIDCEADTISNAVCSSCGEFGEYCCSIGSECNGNDMKCDDDGKCVYFSAQSTTSISTTVDDDDLPTTTWEVAKWDALHDKWTPYVVATLIFIVLVVTGILSWYTKRNKAKKGEETAKRRQQMQHENVQSNEMETEHADV